MNGDEAQRNNAAGMNNRGNMGQRFVEKSGNYSPSTSYNYNNPRTSNANYLPQQQNVRNKPRMDNNNSNNNKFRRPNQNNNNNSNDRVIRQNDIIIRLLKEIRDRLPPPPESLQNAPVDDCGQGYEEQHDVDHEQQPCETAVAEPADSQSHAQPQDEQQSQEEDEDEDRQPAGI